MKLRIEHNLAFVSVVVHANGQSLSMEKVLVDTGSSGTVLSVERLAEIGVKQQSDDLVFTVRGVGGTESVFSKSVDRLQVGELFVEDLEVEVGGLDYGIPMDGILGLDFLLQVGAMIDLSLLEITGRGAE